MSTALYVYDEWIKAIDKDYFVVAVFLDFKNVFDCDCQLLLLKMTRILIKKLIIKHRISTELEVTYGIPQGTVIGLILFLSNIKDMVKYVTEYNLIIFADDTMLFWVTTFWRRFKK